MKIYAKIGHEDETEQDTYLDDLSFILEEPMERTKPNHMA